MNQYRKKLLNAILFFSKKDVKHLNTTKLSKLLYFFDFTHVQQTGYPAIGLKYNAFVRGPVPKAFWLEIKDGIVPKDFKEYFKIIVRRDDFDKEYKELKFIANAEADMKAFTPREQKILDDLAFIYKEATAKQMSEISHLKNQPWDLTYRTKGENAIIDYELAIDSEVKQNAEEIKQLIKEYFEIIKNLELTPTA
jgi:uncharacterized phage-associated protein